MFLAGWGVKWNRANELLFLSRQKRTQTKKGQSGLFGFLDIPFCIPLAQDQKLPQRFFRASREDSPFVLYKGKFLAGSQIPGITFALFGNVLFV